MDQYAIILQTLRILIPTFVHFISVILIRGRILYTVAALAWRIPKLDKQD